MASISGCLEQVDHTHSEAFGNTLKTFQRRVAESPLHTANIGPMEARLLCKNLLRHAPYLTETFDALAHLGQNRIPNGHAYDDRELDTMSLQTMSNIGLRRTDLHEDRFPIPKVRASQR